MSENNVPTFKHGVSRGWIKKLAKNQQRVTRLQNQLGRVPTANMTPDEVNAFFDRKDKAIDEIDELAEEQVEMLAEIVEHVPEDWLIDGAPESLDWSDIESYDWMLQSKYMELVFSVMNGEAFRTNAKN